MSAATPSDSGFTDVINERILKRPTISSYGLIIHTVISGQIHYLIGWVRDTISFKEFIRGSIKPDEMMRYISQMSKREKIRLLSDDFEDLVKDVLDCHQSKPYKRPHEGRECFEQNVIDYRNPLGDSSIGLDETPATFSKGRKQTPDELGIDAAIRETEEEIHIPREIIKIYYRTDPLEEIYVGTDRKLYRNVYFVGAVEFEDFRKASSKIRTKFLKTNYRTTLSDEISKVKWLVYDEAIQVLDPVKKYILRSVNTFLLFNLKRISPQRRHSI
jgi:8-oxo-dGTP pyrophosphatase MutT (NUDIX family)